LKPHYLSDSLLDSLVNIAIRYKDNVDLSLMLPQVNWRQPKNDRHVQISMPAKTSAHYAGADQGATPQLKTKK